MKYEATVSTSCHSELPVGMIVRGNVIDDEVGFTWMTVQLSNGVNRNVIVKDVKVLGEDNV